MFQSFLDKKSGQTAAESAETASRPASIASRARSAVLPQYPGGPVGAPIDKQLEMVARHAAGVAAEAPEAESPAAAPRAPAPAPERDSQKLVVGPRIRLKGEVSNCDELIVEGHFEGKAASRRIRITQGGSYEGEAEVETAEMSGEFDGALTVRDRLIIRASGRVSGTLRYRAIEIESGGRISGDVQVSAEEEEPRETDGQKRGAEGGAQTEAPSAPQAKAAAGGAGS